MKSYVKYLLMIVAALVTFGACDRYDADNHKFDNAVYLDVSKTSEVQMTIFGNNTPTVDKLFQATLAYPADEVVTVSLAADPSLAVDYNARYGTSWPVLDPKYYEISATNVTIPVGKTSSDVVKLHLKELMGEDDQQTGALPIDATYLLPVRISNSSMSVLGGSEIAYYVIKRSSAITTAAQLTNNWIYFASLDKYSANSMIYNNLTAVTYEALIYIDEFAAKDATESPVNISSVMGIEQYLLLRIGDTNFERQQLQFDGSGGGSAFGKFPGKDATKILSKGAWYHVACTYDQQTRVVRVYVNGKIQSEAIDVGIVMPGEKNRINLAMRALYDLYLTDEVNKDKYVELGYDKLSEAYQFFISYSYNEYRPLNGKIAEARVWSVARTPEQIWENMYEILNPKDDASLLGYWKFNDGKGNTVKDHSRYGNDGTAQNDLVWPDGIEIPKINEMEE